MDDVIQKEKEAAGVVEISAISEIIKGAVEPFSKAQEIVAQETTKQTEIISGVKLKMFWGICFIVTCILILAGFALYLDKDGITEKIIIAIVSFLGGLGIGKKNGSKA
jgi:hypothetical protein